MAANGWERCRLGDLVEIKHGWPFKSELFAEDLTGLPIVIGVGNFRYTGGFRFGETSLKEYRGRYPSEFELVPGDILLVMTCQTAGGEILGIPARVPGDGRMYLHNQRLGKVVIRDPARVDLDFLYWLFLSRDFNRELVSSASGTKILHTAPSRIEAFTFELPPLEEQRAIAHILGALDSKIELNRRMNETLEAMARALFKSWFVDFDPVRAKVEGRDPRVPKEIADLFPSRLVESELGEIPDSWEIRLLGDVSRYLNRGISPIYVERNGILVLNQKCVRKGRVNPDHGRRHDQEKRSVDGRILAIGDVLINSTGVGTLGRAGQLLSADEKCIVDSHVTVVRADQSVISWNYLGIDLLEREAELEALGEGSTGQTELARSRLALLPILTPNRELISAFDQVALPLRMRAVSNDRESRTLAAIRDALLPKFISGELRVRDAEKLIERAA